MTPTPPAVTKPYPVGVALPFAGTDTFFFNPVGGPVFGVTSFRDLGVRTTQCASLLFGLDMQLQLRRAHRRTTEVAFGFL